MSAAIAPLGHNNPPGAIELSAETVAALNAFLAGHPVIQTEDEARDAARFIKRGNDVCKDIEAERESKVRPLNAQVQTINQEYRQPRTLLERLTSELKARVTAFAQAEEARRWREAEEKRRQAEEAARLAREAEAREREALEEAAGGVLGVDVADVTTAADTAFAEAQKAAREAARSERDSTVRLGTGYGRALSMRTKETLSVTDPAKAIAAIGLTEDINEAILKGARAFKKLHGQFPAGVTANTERRL